MHAIHDNDWQDFKELMRAWRAGRLTPEAFPQTPDVYVSDSHVVCLHEPLESGGSAKAERLRYSTRNQIQDVQVVGWVEEDPETDVTLPNADTFQLKYRAPGNDDESEDLPETEPISIVAEAEDVLEILKGVPEIAPVIKRVTLGGDTLRRWRIELDQELDSPLFEVTHFLGNQAAVIVQRNQFHGTNKMETVHSVIPTGNPTPMRQGSQCGVRLFPGIGFGVTEAEARKYFILQKDPSYEYDYNAV